MSKSKQLEPNVLAKNLSDEVLQAKHEAEIAVSKFIKLFKGCDYNFKLLYLDLMTNKILVDFSTLHNGDDFLEIGKGRLGGKK